MRFEGPNGAWVEIGKTSWKRAELRNLGRATPAEKLEKLKTIADAAMVPALDGRTITDVFGVTEQSVAPDVLAWLVELAVQAARAARRLSREQLRAVVALTRTRTDATTLIDEPADEDARARAMALREEALATGFGDPLEAIADARMLDLFDFSAPLEALDGIDMARLARALQAWQVMELETRRQKFIVGEIDLQPADWEQIKIMDENLDV